MSNGIYTCDLYHVLYIENYVQPTSHAYAYSNSLILDVPRCLVKHVGVGLRGRAKKEW